MKKLISAIAILLFISLGSCKNSNKESNQSNTTEVSSPADTAGRSSIKPSKIGASDSAGTTSSSGY
ncbi:MAG TPA: hypothetical protein VK590_05750 [Saprospiraceae bacterium]|nr:hypothetical protein [Saprospiraceae bacterium]